MELDAVDVLMLCAVPVEWDSLKELVIGATPDPMLTDPCIRGRIEIDGRSWSAALVEVGMGSAQAGMSTLKAVDKYRPRLVVFVGVAGGIKDVDIGDVVVADKVYYYETGKLVEGAFQARSDTRVVSAHLEGYARKLRAGYTPDSYRVLVGPIASGEKVVADVRSEELARIRAHSGDALALEMEGNAVLAAIDRAAVSPDYFLVRGISDLLEAKGQSDAEGGQERAIVNAREIAAHLIMAWDLDAAASVPVAEVGPDIVEAGFPPPAASEAYVLVAPPQSS